jgi:hypothetical protein
VVGLSGLAQFMTAHELGAVHHLQVRLGPDENGWSLFAVGLMSALVQAFLLGRLLKRFSAQRLAVVGLLSSSMTFRAVGPGHAGLDDGRGDLCQRAGLLRAAGLAEPRLQRRRCVVAGPTMGAVASLNSLMAVLRRPSRHRCSRWCRTCRRATGASARRSISARCCRLRRWWSRGGTSSASASAPPPGHLAGSAH